MKRSGIKWNPAKSEHLKRLRGVSFEDILGCRIIEVLAHPGRKLQNLILFERKGYIWVVPFVKSKGGIFLKTLFPSRKYTRIYLKGIKNEKNGT